MASPRAAAAKRDGSLVEASATTAKTTCPGISCFTPCSHDTSWQLGGKMELTRTRLYWAIWASRNASSKLVSFSLCRPTPFVRKARVGRNILGSITPWSPREEFPWFRA